MKITLTEPAAREIRNILAEGSHSSDRYLRISIKAGGCGGFTYCLDLCSKPEPADTLVEVGGIKMLFDPISRDYLDGLQIDFQDQLVNRGFVFNNPNAKNTCPCGLSFGI